MATRRLPPSAGAGGAQCRAACQPLSVSRGVARVLAQTFSAAEDSEVPWCGFAGALDAADAVPAANTSAVMHAHVIKSRCHMARMSTRQSRPLTRARWRLK